MSKRFPKNNHTDSPAKRARLEVTKQSASTSNNERSKKSTNNRDIQNIQKLDDPWEDDFDLDEDEFAEIDIIASQHFVEPELLSQASTKDYEMTKKVSTFVNTSVVATTSDHCLFKRPSTSANSLQSQVVSGSSLRKTSSMLNVSQNLGFNDFVKRIQDDSHNSTFQSRPDKYENGRVVVPDDPEFEQWKEEKKRLLDDFMTKEGETEFLRQQLQQIRMREENDKREKIKQIEELNQRHEKELSEVKKDNKALNDQIMFLNFELNKIQSSKTLDKLNESGALKYVQPQGQTLKQNIKERSSSPLNRSVPRGVKVKESGVQVESRPYDNYKLKTNIYYYPLKKIPPCIYECPDVEKSVVDIKIEEKIGKRNLAILQEEETFRIFENPELSKPKITMINNKSLGTDFFISDLAKLMTKTEEDINTVMSYPTINKIVATAKELLLNSSIVLQNISQALQNDDIRDMNEVYLSNFYEMPVLHTKSFCDAKAWYDQERGIETRRAIGVMSYIAKTSKYLAEYVAGKKPLALKNDDSYQTYYKDFVSSKSWRKNTIECEFLELISDFVKVVGIVRRSHQFSGLLNAIMNLLVNVKKNVGFCPKGLKKVHVIMKEIIFSRPLLVCFAPMTSVMAEFSECSEFVNKLCLQPRSAVLIYWKEKLSFTPDGCPLEVFLTQLEIYKLDPITVINVTRNLVAFSLTVLLKNLIHWDIKASKACNCCLNLLKLCITNLCECTKIQADRLRERYASGELSWRVTKHEIQNKSNNAAWNDKLREDWTRCDENFWNELRITQFEAISRGIRLLKLLSKRDADFIIRLSCMEDAFHQFLLYLDDVKNLKLLESDQIALENAKTTFVFFKPRDDLEKSTQLSNLPMGMTDESWNDSVPGSMNLMSFYKGS